MQHCQNPTQLNYTFKYIDIQGDSKRWTQFSMSIFPELYMVCELST